MLGRITWLGLTGAAGTLLTGPQGFRGGGTGGCRISYDNGTIAVQF